MDLQRRLSAGELSELLGSATFPTDLSLRRHRISRVAEQVLDQATATERDLLDAYAEGVNMALKDLGARPWEYLPLGATPGALESARLAARRLCDVYRPQRYDRGTRVGERRHPGRTS